MSSAARKVKVSRKQSFQLISSVDVRLALTLHGSGYLRRVRVVSVPSSHDLGEFLERSKRRVSGLLNENEISAENRAHDDVNPTTVVWEAQLQHNKDELSQNRTIEKQRTQVL